MKAQKKKGKRGAIATLSVLFMAVGVAISSYAAMQIHNSVAAQAIDYLPAATKIWSVEPNTLIQKSSDVPIGTFLGTLTIPAINKSVNIFQGTTTKTLAKGVGHYLGSVLPGVADNSVLAGHRDTVFAKLGKVIVGDAIIVRTKNGVFTYQVTRIRIVAKDDKTVIVPTKVATLTLSTCYPFFYIGSAPRRYIVSAELI